MAFCQKNTWNAQLLILNAPVKASLDYHQPGKIFIISPCLSLSRLAVKPGSH